MPVWLLIAIGLSALILGYVTYGRFLEKVFGVNPEQPTPAVRKNDGRDFVPARNWWVLFGHHFASIAGAGPIVGPILALLYWGWVPAVLWIVLGSIFWGGVHDFGSLMVSLRHDARSIADNASRYISPLARWLFLVFVWFALVLVVAVFAHYAALSYVKDAHTVVPSLGIIPVAVLTGWLMYRSRWPFWLVSLLALILLVVLIPLGAQLPVRASYEFWLVILMVYAFIASITPVQYLLQPRDYLSSYLLILGMGLLLVGGLFSGLELQVPAFQQNSPSLDVVPFLFVTIACGAISGFHSLINSGTTARQLPSERYARRIGYGAMLLEGLLALLVVAAVGALPSGHDAANPIGTFGKGVAHLLPALGDTATYFAILLLNAFILTTLDTATRIARYVTVELTGLQNRYVATAMVVGVAVALLWGGQANRMWTVFGAANQLLAALALLVVAGWLLARRTYPWVAMGPAAFMLVITIWALVQQVHALWAADQRNYLAIGFAALLVLLGVAMGIESLRAWLRSHPLFRRAA